MASVFAGFILAPDTVIASIGFALAIGVLVDAFVVRMTLTPAAMTLLGKTAWYLPRWLDRVLPNIDIEGERLLARLAAQSPGGVADVHSYEVDAAADAAPADAAPAETEAELGAEPEAGAEAERAGRHGGSADNHDRRGVVERALSANRGANSGRHRSQENEDEPARR